MEEKKEVCITADREAVIDRLNALEGLRSSGINVN